MKANLATENVFLKREGPFLNAERFQIDLQISLNSRRCIYSALVRLFIALLIIQPTVIVVFAQEDRDSLRDGKAIEKVQSNKGIRRLLELISKDPKVDEAGFTVRSEQPFLTHHGKIVRKISITPQGFDRILLDTVYRLRTFAANVGSRLHADTRESVIRNHLFIREGQPLNAYRLADNERTIRNLDFILDARIFVKTISQNIDSVDLLVITRDVFSIGGSINVKPPRRYGLTINDKNIAGLGHRIQFRQAFDEERTPRYAYDINYELKNLLGTFIDFSLGYIKLNRGISVGNENERSYHFKLKRDLFQPFARFAGGVEYSDNRSRNVYKEPINTFARYHYRIQDYWFGYSFAHRRFPNDLKVNRHRDFVALRSFKQHFLAGATNIDLTEPDRFAYRERRSIQGQVTFFRQDFYRTHYVLGFGRTEDVPYGYRTSFTVGWEKELGFKRAYTGMDLFYSRVQPTGSIFSFNLRLASFWNEKRTEDGLFSFHITKYSKINNVGTMIMRSQFESGYAILFNQHVKRGIDIRNLNGIVGFFTDSLVGAQRFTLSQEVTMFTKWKLLGFRLAPTGRAEVALIKRSNIFLQRQNIFAGLSVGVRARNENLIFDTIEGRIFYYPKTVEGLDSFRATIITNFRVRYPTNLLSKPSTVFPYY